MEDGYITLRSTCTNYWSINNRLNVYNIKNQLKF